MDTLVAVLGPLAALIYLAYNPDEYNVLFLIAFFPGFLAIVFHCSGKTITYPTDIKLNKQIIAKCIGIAKTEDIVLRQSYMFTLKKLNTLLRCLHTKNGSKQVRKAGKKIKTFAARLVRERFRNLDQQRLLQH